MQKFQSLIGYVLILALPLFFFYAVSLLAGSLFATSTQEPDAVTLVAPVDENAPAEAASEAVAAIAVSPEAGAKVFKKCRACHTIDDGGEDKIGPHLWGTFMRPVASAEGFGYSDGMAALADQSWDVALLDAFLAKPKDLIAGTTMSFAGLRKEADRQNLIAYMAAQSSNPVSVADLGFTAGATDAPAAAQEEEEEVDTSFLDSFQNPPGRSAEEQAEIDSRVTALLAEVAGLDYERARFHPLHFPPAINSASSEECLVCHQEIMEHKPLEVSPAGVPATDTIAWYQTLATYVGEQESFHYRHLESDYAQAVMNLECTFCHQGNDPREETPDLMPGRDAFTAAATPEFTLRKMVNPSESCLMCHGAFPDAEEIMGLSGPWHEARADFEDEETLNGCLSCHGEYGFRTNRHNVDYLNAHTIEDLASASSDTCYGCHGGRQWYRISYPYPRHPWPDMDEETPDWATRRPTQSNPAYQLAPLASE